MDSYVKDDLSKFFAIGQLGTTFVVFDFDPSNGNLNDARELSFPSLTSTRLEFSSSGAISDNMLVLCGRDNRNTTVVNFLNTDTWTVSSFNAEEDVIFHILGYSQLFSTDQIVLLIRESQRKNYVIKTAYDRLNLTELFTS